VSLGIEVDAGQLGPFIESKLVAIQKAVKGAALVTGELVTNEAKRHLLQPRRLNVQDSESPGVGRRAIQLSVDAQGVDILLFPHWTKARTKTIFAIFSREGRTQDLERQGLWVDPTGKRNSSRGYATRSGLRFFEFASQPKLFEWAQRRERGRQLFRHAVFLDSVEARKALILTPALNRYLPKLEKDVIEGVARA
jgi:hypothetical protein